MLRIFFSANRFSNRKSGPDQIQLLVVDTDGTGKEAKIEVDKLKKGIGVHYNLEYLSANIFL